MVLEGIFSDEYRDYGPSTYVRSPPGSSHSPFSDSGCMIFVKLHQMEDDEQERVQVDTSNAEWRSTDKPGLERFMLFERGDVRITLVRAKSGCRVGLHDHPAGEEIFMLEGSFEDEHRHYEKNSWIRVPAGSSHVPWGSKGAFIWISPDTFPQLILKYSIE